MALTDKHWQYTILVEVGGHLLKDDEGCDACLKSLSLQMPTLWEMNADMAESSGRLRYLYTKRQAIHWLLGQLRTHTNATVGPLNLRKGEMFDNLMRLLEAVNAEIKEENENLGDAPFEVQSFGCV